MHFRYFMFFSTFMKVFSYNLNRNTKNNIKLYHTIKDNKNDYINDKDFLLNKKLITVSPGGYRGFYMFGIGKFIKTNYDLSNYVFTGASAGAWVSLFMSSKMPMNKFEKYLVMPSLKNLNSILSMEKTIKNQILSEYTEKDFDLKRLFIGVTTVSNCKSNSTIFTNFINLEDAIDCCIASSHIPLITGGINNVYRNVYTFDGGFSRYPFLHTINSSLDITPYYWDDVNGIKKSRFYTTLLNPGKYNFKELIEKGFQDSSNNKKYLDEKLQ